MSWSEFWTSMGLLSTARRSARTALVLSLAAGLSGCFHPLYGSLGSDLAVNLRAIAVDPVPERLGHYLRDALITNLNGTGEAVAPRYRLTLNTRERVQTALVDITSSRAQDGAVITDIEFKLLPIEGGAAIAKGTITSAAVYDRSQERYANIRAARDAEIRDAKAVADQITTTLAAKLSDRSAAPAKP